MADWQPIKTAPKDGTQILAFAKGKPAGRVPFYGVTEWAEAKSGFPRSMAGRFWPFATRPTHWMPLPQPPSEAP